MPFYRYTLLLFSFLLISGIFQKTWAQEAKNFTATDVNGRVWNLFEELNKGHTVVLDFFFADCTPCQSLTPSMSELFTDYGGDTGKIVVLGISNRDNDTTLRRFEADYGGEYPSIGIEGGGDTITNLYTSWFSFNGWPTYAVVCPNRNIVWNLERKVGFEKVREAIDACPSLGVGEAADDQMLLTYPNPTTGPVFIPLEGVSLAATKLLVYNANGKNVAVNSNFFEDGIRLNLSNLSAGFYVIHLTNNGTLYHSKILIE
ncbi:MAG: thiol-disulfide isomerase/thioredoxin [Bacteroidia bacterium]|jgi:thiol-disulfide isomerase/thioredoxin